MVSEFQKQIDSLTGVGRNPGLLPLTHVTSWLGFLAITKAGQFLPRKPCPVYGGLLVYSFYGRPAYRFKEDGLSHNVPTFAPVCFILKSEVIKQAIRIMPFDSGGFAKYVPAIHPALKREDYELSLGPNSSRRLVKRLWSTNRKYFESQPLASLPIGAANVALLHYYNLITTKISTEFDPRCSSVEIQVPAPLGLDGIIEAIVAPSNVAGKEVKRIAKSLKAEVVIYEFDMPYHINDFSSAVRRAVRSYFKVAKYFS